MITEVLVPELGSDPAEPIVVSLWFADEGDEVFQGDRLVELVIGGATFDVSAPADGRLVEVCVPDSDVVQVGDVLGFIETE
jgi:pyruvate/2-oxoglutarate dehydrogenase complex dihydrolipoamide acyltransferase (E2) component